ncbi:hypothetical protein MMC07_000824 [Pseudocyphellaria aurata]|nr:hypothetical protein [Pseudocyphellaria aurata]
MDSNTPNQQAFNAKFEQDRMQQHRSLRDLYMSPYTYNFKLAPVYQYSDYVIIGRHFTFRNYAKRDDVIASLLKIKFPEHKFPGSDRFEPWHRRWVENRKSTQDTHWALQRNADKPIDDVAKNAGWENRGLVKNFERGSGLAPLRDLLLLVDPQGWSEGTKFPFETEK